MKRILTILLILASFATSFAAYEEGDVVDDLSWKDSNGEDQSIYSLTAQGKVVVLFWGDFT